ncbi:hypothetical protein ANN_19814 [Periplaneta americana]|uniref:Uncharacterized protein n=1 Tax=Periplaneta americana TaxID=6978 RepID=A0ABQ8SAX0_PERAM|nr:hypothetical protein ANN_19814 [Periplaneta americana]
MQLKLLQETYKLHKQQKNPRLAGRQAGRPADESSGRHVLEATADVGGASSLGDRTFSLHILYQLWYNAHSNLPATKENRRIALFKLSLRMGLKAVSDALEVIRIMNVFYEARGGSSEIATEIMNIERNLESVYWAIEESVHRVRSSISTALREAKWEMYEEVHCIPTGGSYRQADIVTIDRKRKRGLILHPIVRRGTRTTGDARYVDNSMSVPPLPVDLRELRHRIINAFAQIDRNVLHRVWDKLYYRIYVYRALIGAHIEYM